MIPPSSVHTLLAQWRPSVERSIAWLVHAGNRRLRYRGVVATDIWLHPRRRA